MRLGKSITSFLVFVSMLVMVFSLQSISAAAPSATKTVKSVSFALDFDGKALVLPDQQYVFVVNGTSYIPLRFVSYALQKNVQWNSQTSTVVVSEPTSQQLVSLKEYLLNAVARDGETSAKGEVDIRVSS